MSSYGPKQLGRGVNSNPSNRFERLELSPDYSDWTEEDLERKAKTTFYKDSSRSFITYNKSPDIGYDASINPYRGCEHGCVYCLSGDTPVLMASGKIKILKDIRPGDKLIGTHKGQHYRYYTETQVLRHWETRKPAYRICLEDGTELVAGEDHRFLTERGWKFVTGSMAGLGVRPFLTPNNKLMGTGAFSSPPEMDTEYQQGYLSGMIRGDGHLASYRYQREGRKNGDQYQFRLALIDDEALARSHQFLKAKGINTRYFIFQKKQENHREIKAIRTHSKPQVEQIFKLIQSPETLSLSWAKGFLAGIFDAEGSYQNNTIRITNSDDTIIRDLLSCLELFGFRYAIELVERLKGKSLKVIRILGGLAEHLRLFHLTESAISRKCSIEGYAVKSNAKLQVKSIEALGEMLLYDISTTTEDFIANGVVSHNCYARPTHEYLGFSAGLDFETKIMVKTDGPELLRQELAHKNWKPQVVGFSGVTDIYQPIERKLELTRRCLEVFAEFLNPIGMVTKNHLITRDIDVIKELAKSDAVSVAISITTLNEDLRRVMEPRTSTAQKRLEAVAELAEAGIHVGVLTAPIIPGLTDHEIPALVKASVAAGAKFVGYNIVHLPFGTKELLEAWLEEHFPDRKDKVLNRIREMRGGKLNDPRFGYRMTGQGVYADQIKQMHRLAKHKAGLKPSSFKLVTEHFRVPGRMVQGRLF